MREEEERGRGGREEEGGERGNTIMYVYKVVIALRNLCLHSKLKLTADVTKEVHPTIRYGMNNSNYEHSFSTLT